MRSSELLRMVGEALYGELFWRARMADGLRVDRRTIKQWETGRRTMPPAMWAALALAVHEQEKKLMHARRLMARHEADFFKGWKPWSTHP